MDFDFTDDDGIGVSVVTDRMYGILLANMDRDNYAGNWITPTEARAIAEALTTAADHMEETR